MADYGDELSLAVARRLGDLRRDRGWSMERLADEAGLHRTSVGLIERGRRGITIAVAGRLARAMGTSLGTIVLEAEEKLVQKAEQPC